MELAAFEAVAQCLADGGVRYLAAGGLAVNAHGYLRLTHDIDLVIALQPVNVGTAFEALALAGYRPIVPVSPQEFGDASIRQRWIDEKGMRVLNFFSDRYPATSVDVFVQEPFDFDTEYERAMIARLADDLEARFVSIPTLIAMKQAADRPRDRDDIKHLRWMLEQDDGHDG